MNSITISGKAWEPECKYLPSGVCITEISVSVYDGKDKEGKAKYFSVKCKMFKELAENVANQIVKGENVVVSGRMSEDKWEKDGVKHYKTVLIVDTIAKEISRFGQPTTTTNGQPASNDVNSFGTDVNDEEIPF